MDPTLFAAALVAFVAGGVYMVVAHEFRQRTMQVFSESRRALLFFSLWWAALGANIVLGGGFILLASLGYTNFPLQLVYANLQRLLLAVSLVGLMYYLLYLLTGKNWLPVLAPYYAVFFLSLIYSMYRNDPQGVYVGAWRTDLEYGQTSGAGVALIHFVMLVLPPVVASLVYFFRFVGRAEGRTHRFRITIVSWSLVLWWVMAVIAGQREAFGNEQFQFVNRFTGLLVAVLILIAYRPPAPLRRWLESAPADAPRST